MHAKRVATIAVALATQELLLRLLFPLPELPNFNRIHYMPRTAIPSVSQAPNTKHQALSPASIRNVRMIWDSEPDHAHFEHRLNAYGFRGPTPRLTKPAGKTRAIFVGDSFVEGLMVNDPDTIPAAFAQTAPSSHPVEALNFGVAGSGLEHEIHLILDALPAFKPDLLFLVLYANDLPAPPSSELRSAAAAAHTLPHRNPCIPRALTLLRLWRDHEMLPWRWPWQKIPFLTPVPDPSNLWSHPDQVAQLTPIVAPNLADAMRRGTFNAFRAGGPMRLEPQLKLPVDVRAQLATLRAAAAGTDLRVVYLPERNQVTDYYRRFDRELSLGLPEVDLMADAYQQHARTLATQCAEADIPFLDLTPPLRQAESRGEHLYWNYDDHMRPAGHHLIANQLWAWLGESAGR